MPLPIDENPFQWMKPNERSALVIEMFREHFANLHQLILNSVPNCRERSLGITKLEEAAMWTIKAAVGRIE